MVDPALLTFVHVVLFAYWLGADLGVFYASFIVTDASASVAARAAAARILFALDQAPRVAMTLTLPTGVHLAWALRLIDLDAWLIAALWLVSLAWLAAVVALHRLGGRPFAARLARVDFAFRVVLVAGLSGVAMTALATGRLVALPFVAFKLLAFAAIVACGLMIRVKLAPFGPAWARLVSAGPDPATDATIRNSLRACRPFVVTIWFLLLLSAALGLRVV